MKKLLSLIGAFALTASATSVLISCSNDKDDDKYGNVFINDDGDFKITTEDLLNWYNETYGRLGKDPQKFLVQFYNIFAVAIYEEASKENNIFQGISAEKNPYMNEDGRAFAESLKTQYGKESKASNTIYGRANTEMERARKEYLDNKKQGTKAWVKYLKGQFPWVTGDQTALENAWISNYILTDSTNSAYANLSKALGFGATESTWAKGYSTIEVNRTTISNLLSVFLTQNGNVLINNETLDKTIKEQATTEAQQISIINLVNALGGKNAFKSSNSSNYNETINTENNGTTFKIEFIENTNDVFLNALTWRTFLSGISSIFANSPNSINGTISQISSSNNNIFKYSDVESIRLADNNIYKDFYNYNARSSRELNKTQIVSVAPVLNSSKDNQKNNILSNSQKFLVDNYFETKKPVATSEIVLEFSKINSTATPDINKEISPAQFVNNANTQTELINYFEGFYQFYNAYVSSESASSYANAETSTSTGLTDFETFYRGSNKNNLWKLGQNQTDTGIINFLTAKNNEKLLTLDYDTTTGTYSNIAKYSVYDFLSSNPKEDVISTKNEWDADSTNMIGEWASFEQKMTNVSTDATNGKNLLFNLVNDLGRHAETEANSTKEGETAKPYKVLNAEDGIIAFIDSDGLHFMKIDGYSLLNSSNAEKSETSVDKDKQQSIAYDLLSKTNKELIPYLLNPKLSSSTEAGNAGEGSGKINKIDESTAIKPGINNDIYRQNIIDNMGTEFGNDYSKIINYSITNDYERFLVNNTVANGFLSTDEEKTNLFYNFDILADAKATTSTTENFGLLSQWLWTYLDEILGTNGDYAELFGKFFEIEGEDVDTKAVYELIKVITTEQETLSAAPLTSFTLENNNWNQSVEDNYEKQHEDLKTETARSFIPKNGLEISYSSIVQSQHWKTDLSTKSKFNKLNYIISDKWFNDEVIINVLNKHEGGVK
ncbi:lipoprotein [Mesoplasma florum]|uniref:lipoprotein n=1 Tax=Mesoplasma florum TaxID=2151 RepID=UPI000BE2B06B|nr:lipoprotein [Mesoplasma florum]ATI73206.1 hypothetical protein CQZ69_01345 [Mesoplasma florum]ATI73893.1 hypothetical protein CQZ70_01330 [Mesoplasma florum]AVN61608.1 hypothetical protein CG004_01345 [Mesoplasma florum]